MLRLGLSFAASRLKEAPALLKYLRLYRKYRPYTMVAPANFIGCLLLIDRHRHVPGLVVECGVWRGGMSAAMAEVLGPNRTYYLFDSFEGLPEPTDRDGERAKTRVTNPHPLGTLEADIETARETMRMSGAPRVELVKGWFKDTLPDFTLPEPIAFLRIDGDWYESTMECLTRFFPSVAPGGIIVLDDYFVWDGCARALHDYLSHNDIPCRIRTAPGGVCHVVKQV